jgi:hypothetical protein
LGCDNELLARYPVAVHAHADAFRNRADLFVSVTLSEPQLCRYGRGMKNAHPDPVGLVAEERVLRPFRPDGRVASKAEGALGSEEACAAVSR